MLRLLARCAAVHLLIMLLAAPAYAGEVVVGDGFQMQVPHGFRRVPANTPTPSAASRLKLTEGLNVEGAPEILACVSGLEISPDAVLLVTRIILPPGSEIGTVSEMQQYALRSMGLTQRQFDERGEQDGIHIRNTRVGDYDALEVIHTGDNADKVDGNPATRFLSVLGGDFLLVIVLINLDGGDAGTPLVWRGVIDSLQVDAPGILAVRAVLYGGLGFFLLLIIFFVRRLHGSPQSSTNWVDRTSKGSALSMEGWGNGMSLDEAPAQAPIPKQADPVPVLAGMGPGGHGATHENDATPPGLSRTLPSSPLREIPNSLPSARTPEPRPTAPRPSHNPPAVSTTPTPAARPIRSDGSAVVPAPQPMGGERSPGQDARPRGGLSSPIPSSGRWSDRG